MSRYVKRVFTAEAVVVGCGFALMIGGITGLAAGLLTQSLAIGLIVGTVVCLGSMEILFRGKHE